MHPGNDYTSTEAAAATEEQWDEWLRLIQEAKKPHLHRIECGAAMYARLCRINLYSMTDVAFNLLGVPLIFASTMDKNVAHLFDQDNNRMFTLVLCADGDKMLKLMPIDPEPKYDIHRPLEYRTPGPNLLVYLEIPATIRPRDLHAKNCAKDVRMEPSGACPDDGGEPREDQAGGGRQ